MDTTTRRHLDADRPTRGFTLLELLVVIVIVVLVAAATLPTIVPALNRRRVSEAARLLQASLAGAHDAALRAQGPRGIRLLPDPEFSGGSNNGALASNRMISIEAAPVYNTGYASVYLPPSNAVLNNPYYLLGNEPSSTNYFQLSITEEIWADPAPVGTIHGGLKPLGGNYNSIPNEPTSWYWNIRQGDRVRFTDSGTYYTIAGPMKVGPYSPDPNNPSTLVPTNTQRFINYGPPGSVRDPATGLPTATGAYSPNPFATNHYPEILYLVNGLDDDNDGWIDESFDGIDNDGDGIIDPGYNGIDDDGDGVVDNQAELLIGNEFEAETFVGGQFNGAFLNETYAIERRPVVSPGSREVALPQGAVIDLTTWNAAAAVISQTTPTPATTTTNPPTPILPERSRLPVDPFSYTVDILIAPNGSVVPSGAGSSGVGQSAAGVAPASAIPFYHFWIAEREDVQEPLFGFVGVAPPVAGHQGVRVGLPVVNPNWPSVPYMLPQPKGATNVAGTVTYQTPSGNNGPYLTGDRRLVTLFTRTGAIVTNEIETFDPTNVSAPYYAAQLGTRENK